VGSELRGEFSRVLRGRGGGKPKGKGYRTEDKSRGEVLENTGNLKTGRIKIHEGESNDIGAPAFKGHLDEIKQAGKTGNTATSWGKPMGKE